MNQSTHSFSHRGLQRIADFQDGGGHPKAGARTGAELVVGDAR